MEYHPSLRERLRVRLRRRALEQVRSALEPDGVRVLDLGGGTGCTSVVLGRGASEIVVVDPSPRQIARGRASGTPATYVEARAESLPWLDGRFERVASMMSFHHFDDPDRALAETHRVLAPGGRLVVFDVDAASWSGRWMRFWETRVLGHGFAFTGPRELEQRIRRAGFTSVRSERVGSRLLAVAGR